MSGERSSSEIVDGCCRAILMNGSMWMLLAAAMRILATMARRTQDIARYRVIGVILGRGVGKSGTAVAALGSVQAGGGGTGLRGVRQKP